MSQQVSQAEIGAALAEAFAPLSIIARHSTSKYSARFNLASLT